jgi:hypothetical protein
MSSRYKKETRARTCICDGQSWQEGGGSLGLRSKGGLPDDGAGASKGSAKEQADQDWHKAKMASATDSGADATEMRAQLPRTDTGKQPSAQRYAKGSHETYERACYSGRSADRGNRTAETMRRNSSLSPEKTESTGSNARHLSRYRFSLFCSHSTADSLTCNIFIR